MRIIKKMLLWLVIVLAFILILGCQSNLSEKSKANANLDRIPDQELWNARVTFTQNERITSILNAPHLEIFEKEGLTIADSSFRLDLYDVEGKHSSLLIADSGVVKGEDSLLAFGKVIAVSDSGVTLNTERLFWSRWHKNVRSDTAVLVTTATDTLFGDSLLSDESLYNWEVYNPKGKTVRELQK
jgi:LPS export ABC transporter protein LptC